MTRPTGRHSKSLPALGQSRRRWTQVTQESSAKLSRGGQVSATRDTTAKLELFIVCRLGECCIIFECIHVLEILPLNFD